MNLLRLGPKLDGEEWEVLWYAASYHADFTDRHLVSRTPGGHLHNVPKTELLMLNVDVILQALQNRMALGPTYYEQSVLKKLLALKKLEKRS